MGLQAGDKISSASLVTITDEGPKTVNLTELTGRKTVLLFFPLVNTGVCHSELCSVRDSIQRYNDLDARVVAISVDPPFAQKLWAEKEGFNFEFWSDFNKEAISAIGNAHEDLVGLKGVSKRSAFVLDSEGVVRFAWVSDDPKQLPDFDAIRKCLSEIS